MLNKIKTLKDQLLQKGSFAQNFAMLFSSNLISQLIGLMMLPIISRLYPPEIYGVFSIFIVLVTTIGVFASFKYEAALVLPTTDKEFKALLHLTLFLLVIVTFLSIIIFGFFGASIFSYFKRPQLYSYWYLLPISVFLLGMRNIIGGWNVRDKEYKKSSIIGIIRNISGRVLNILYALVFTASFLGLIWGDLLTSLLILVLNFVMIITPKIKPYLKRSTWGEMRAVARKYRSYPFVIFPGSLLEMVSSQLPIYFFAAQTQDAFVGLYVFGERLLSIPLTMINNAIAPVFLQKIVEVKQDREEEMWAITRKLLIYLLGVIIIPFSFLIVFGDILFKYVFGSAWETSGIITGYLGLYYILQMMWVPTCSVFNALRKEKVLFSFSMLIFITRVSILSIGVVFLDSLSTIFYYSIGNATIYFLGILFIAKTLKGNVLKMALLILAIMGSSIFVLKALRYFIEWFFL